MISPESKSPAAVTPWTRVAPEKRSASLRYYHRQAQINMANGLTSTGKVRQRRPNAKTKRERNRMALERSQKAAVKRILVCKMNGLTTRGTPRIIPVNRGDAWILQTQIEKLVRELAACYHDLPPKAQARVIELEKTLSAIRRCTT
jgi:hypothetical protein